MNSHKTKKEANNVKNKQRTPRQVQKQRNITVYFARSSSTLSTETDSDDSLSLENGKVRKRKNETDPLKERLSKIRKTFEGNGFSSNEETIQEVTEDELEIEDSSSASISLTQSPVLKKVLQENHAKNTEIICEQKVSKFTSIKDVSKENIDDSQWTESLEDLDDFFKDEWTVDEISTIELILDSPKRCLILDIVWEKHDMTLSVRDEVVENSALVKCCGFWRHTKIQPGELVIIKAKRETNGKHWIVDNMNGFVINQPDTLISGTSVVSALWCNRRSVFTELFRGIESLPYNSSGSSYMLVGSLTHELLQKVLDQKLSSIKEITACMEELITSKKAIYMMYETGISSIECRKMMQIYIPQIYQFVKRYIDGVLPFSTDKNFNGKIETIRDIEENIWLPTLGLKGRIDLTVEVSDNPKNKLASKSRRLIPLELKTGRASFAPEHRGQLILYTIMMSYTGREVNSGLLLYLKENIMQEIKGSHNEQRDLILLRNNVSYYTTRKPKIIKTESEEKCLPMELPDPISHPACSKCPYNVLCCSYLSEQELEKMAPSHEVKKLHAKATSHLSEDHTNYVKQWVSMLQIEDSSEHMNESSWKDVWTLDPLTREKNESCISNVKVNFVVEKHNKFMHQFQRCSESGLSDNLKVSEFRKSDYVIISTDSRVNICSGFIQAISESTVTVTADKDIVKLYGDQTFHIDRGTSSSLLLQNFSQIGGLLDDNEICNKLRRIIIDRTPATFTADIPESIMQTGADILARLNRYQRRAIMKVFASNDYVLIKGMPGTGKTQTVVALIELLIKLNKSVLITAHTNSAVDNILMKLLDRGVDFIRLGSTSKIHTSLTRKSEDYLLADCDSPEAIHTVYSSKQAVGVTCYGANHPHMSKRTFDICIVDESTQVMQPTILRPLYCASKFVLVGDPKQLPPIAKNSTARKLGMTESLFTRLDSENNSISLVAQYRMNKCIMDVANKLTYQNQLKVGSEEIGNAILPIIDRTIFDTCERWLKYALSSRLKNSTIMLNTSSTHHLPIDPDLGKLKGTCNIWEAAMILRLTDVLIELGVCPTTIGVIAPFRAQVHLLKRTLPTSVEVNTVDQYQGRDKSVILYSCTKSVPQDYKISEFDILKDQQRLTVAVTRAKHKLIIIGDKTSLIRYTPFSNLFDALENEHIKDLQDGVDDFSFEDLGRLIH